MSGLAMPLAVLAAYTAADATPRRVAVLVLGPSLDVPRPAAAVLAARLAGHAALVLDTGVDGTGAVRVIAELAPGEGLAAVQALIDDYLPRARRAVRPLARALQPEDLLGNPGGEQTGSRDAEAMGEEEPWAA